MDGRGLRNRKQFSKVVADGLRCDTDGNVWCGARPGVLPVQAAPQFSARAGQLALQVLQQALLVDDRQNAVNAFVVENIHDGLLTLSCFYSGLFD